MSAPILVMVISTDRRRFVSSGHINFSYLQNPIHEALVAQGCAKPLPSITVRDESIAWTCPQASHLSHLVSTRRSRSTSPQDAVPAPSSAHEGKAAPSRTAERCPRRNVAIVDLARFVGVHSEHATKSLMDHLPHVACYGRFCRVADPPPPVTAKLSGTRRVLKNLGATYPVAPLESAHPRRPQERS
jgi:hypothetical protein